jgi:hypothetical protein
MQKDVNAAMPRPGLSRFFHYLSLGLGAAAVASAVLTFLEMKAAQAGPGEMPGSAPGRAGQTGTLPDGPGRQPE